MATKSLNFKEETIERFKELFPEYANGNMSAAVLGEEITQALVAARTQSQDGLVPGNESEATKQLRADYEKVNTQLTKLNEQYSTLNNQYEQLRASYNQEHKDYEKLRGDYESMTTSYEQKMTALDTRTSELQALQAKYDDLRTKYDTLVQAGNESNEGHVAELRAQIEELQASLATKAQEHKDYEATSTEKYEKLRAKYEALRTTTREARGGNTVGETPGTMPTNNEYINRVLDIVCQRVNKKSGTAYTLDDVVAQTIFKVMYERGNSITPYYPITRDELLHELQNYEPDITSHEQMAAYMIHKIKSE